MSDKVLIYCSDVSDSVTQCLASTLTSWGLNLSSPHLPALSASAPPTPLTAATTSPSSSSLPSDLAQDILCQSVC